MKEGKVALRYAVGLALLLVAPGAAVLYAPACQARPTSRVPERAVRAEETSEIRAAWEAQYQRLERRSKDYPSNKLNILLSLLRMASPTQVAKEYELLIGLPFDYAHLPEYEQTLTQAFVTRFTQQNDKASLVKLLSLKPPRYVATLPLELFLAINADHGLLALFEGYEAAANEQSRNMLLETLWRAFRTQSQSVDNKERFVSESKQWYLKNRSKLKVNPYYHPYSASSSSRQLFTLEESPGKRERRHQ